MSTGPEKAAANYAWMVEHGQVPARPNRPPQQQVARYYRYEQWRAALLSHVWAALARRSVPPRERFAYYAFAERVARHQRIYTNRMLERFTDIEVDRAVFRGLDREVLVEIAGLLTRQEEQP